MGSKISQVPDGRNFCLVRDPAIEPDLVQVRSRRKQTFPPKSAPSAPSMTGWRARLVIQQKCSDDWEEPGTGVDHELRTLRPLPHCRHLLQLHDHRLVEFTLNGTTLTLVAVRLVRFRRDTFPVRNVKARAKNHSRSDQGHLVRDFSKIPKRQQRGPDQLQEIKGHHCRRVRLF